MRLIQAKKNNVKRNRKIIADEYLPQSYADLGYDGLDDAIRAVTELRYELQYFIDNIDNTIEEYDEFGGPVSVKEWFSGPEDAIDFADMCYDMAKTVRKLDVKFIR